MKVIDNMDRRTRLRLLVVLGPLAVLALSALCYAWLGQVALLLPPVLIGIFLGWCYMDLRGYQLKLFERDFAEQNATFAQVEAIIALNGFLRPGRPFPATRGWAASPDLLLEMVNHVLLEKTELVVEASSGVSTVMLAYAMERKGSGRVIALEHDASYAAKTRALLDYHCVAHRATVVHAPLVEQQVDGDVYKWYDLSKAAIDAPIGLLVVDGPPEATGPMARYPAVPLLRDKFAPGARVLLDDGARAAERLMAERWKTGHRAVSCELLPMDKAVWSLRF